MVPIDAWKQYQAWLDSLHTGDEVIVIELKYHKFRHGVVKRITPTRQIVVDTHDNQEHRFRSDGMKMVNGYRYAQLLEPTQERIASMQRESVIQFLITFQWECLSHDDLDVLHTTIQRMLRREEAGV